MTKKLSLLNKKQRKWLDNFLKDKPGARLTNVYKYEDGDRVVEVEWQECTIPIVLDSYTLIQGKISYKVKVKLRKFGDPRKTAEFSYKITQPQKQYVSYRLKEQLSIELPQSYFVPTPQNPVVVKPKAKIKKKVYESEQLTLPLSRITSQLNDINLKTGGAILSEQELLLETTLHLNLDTGKEIKLPTAIITILKEKKATLKEWESAISLYQVAGPSAVLSYLQELDGWRKLHKTQSDFSIQKAKKIVVEKQITSDN